MNKTSWFFFFASFWSKIFLAETIFALIVEFERMPSNQLTTPQKRVLERLSLSAPSRCLFVCLSAFNSRWSIDCNAYATFEREHNVLRLIISTVCTVCVCLMPKIQAQDFFKFKTVIVISKPSIYLSLALSWMRELRLCELIAAIIEMESANSSCFCIPFGVRNASNAQTNERVREKTKKRRWVKEARSMCERPNQCNAARI